VAYLLEGLGTEKRNARTQNLDEMTTREFLETMNQEDQQVAVAVGKTINQIDKVAEMTAESFRNGGRLIYIGAGTSGRLGVLDAVECPPTFSTQPDQVVGLIAGGEKAFVKAVEGAEDSFDLAAQDLEALTLNKDDMVIGIAASGRTPYVIGGLRYARQVGAKTAAVACNINSLIGKEADVAIEVETGPEVLTGSTRLKAGTAQKLVLNMISTASMIAIGKAYNNLMVDVNLSNEKLVDRAKRIIMQVTGVSYKEAEEKLEAANRRPKVAIVMIETDSDCQRADDLLVQASGFVKKAIVLGKEGK
jgi:N-acetylmuramic acid 6-phosphate etherase